MRDGINRNRSGIIPAIDVPELCRYGQSRNVGVIPPFGWYGRLLDRIDDCRCPYEKWGVKGVKSIHAKG